MAAPFTSQASPMPSPLTPAASFVRCGYNDTAKAPHRPAHCLQCSRPGHSSARSRCSTWSPPLPPRPRYACRPVRGSTSQAVRPGRGWTGEAWRSSRCPSLTAHPDSRLRPPMLDGEMLRDRRIAANLSIRAVADQTGIPAQTLRALEAGRQAADRQLILASLERLTQLLDVDTGELFI